MVTSRRPLQRAADSADPARRPRSEGLGSTAHHAASWSQGLGCHGTLQLSRSDVPSFMPSQVIGWHSRLTRATSF